MHYGHCLKAGVKHCLLSYLQFYKHDLGMVRARKRKNPEMQFMVDSGAFTFITEWQKFTSWKRSDFEEYLDGYVKWLRKNKDYVTIAVEYDIDHTLNMILGGNANSTIGGSIVQGWQEQMFRPLVEEGMDVIFVWHENRGMDGWEDMCRRYAHVGMPGHFSSKPDLMNRHISVARRYLTKIHGFAATKQLDFRDVPWFTVDSITWKTGEMYGTLIVWDERQQKLIFEDDKTKRVQYRHIIDKAGFNSSSIIADSDYKEVTRFGLWSMRQMELFYERLYKTRPFYYEVRLPHWQAIAKLPAKEAMNWWHTKLRAADLFKQHTNRPLGDVLKYLTAIAAAQYGDLPFLSTSPVSLDFLKAYFPKIIDPLVSDPTIIQKELANYVIPPNPPALLRTAMEHYETDMVLKLREEEPNAIQDGSDLDFHPFTDDLG